MINRLVPLVGWWILLHPVIVSAESTTTYTSGNTVTNWEVPQGVQSIDVEVTGAGGGGSSYSNSRGGHGATVAVSIPTTPGETLTIGVGSGGQGGTPGGGGGGMSYIKRGTEYLVIAGGGGGGAYGGFSPKYIAINGGDGAKDGTPAGGDGGNAYSCSSKDAGGNCTSETNTWTEVADTGGKGGNGISLPGAKGVGGLDDECRTPAPGCSDGTAGTAYNGGNGSAAFVGGNPTDGGGQGATGTAGGNKGSGTGSGGGGAGAGGGGGGAWINPHDGGGGAGGSYVIASLMGATFQAANNGGPGLINYGASNGGSGSVQIVINEPDAPTNVQAARGNGQVTVSWTAPADNGATITAYTVTASSGETCATTGTGAPTTCIVSGLTNGTSYTFTVVATNEGGDSPASAASNAVVPATIPAAPTNAAAVAVGDTTITLSWTVPDNGGSAITDYEYSYDAGSSWLSLGTTGTSATITGLTNGTAYTLIIRAVNAVGGGVASAGVTATPAAVPAAPTGLVATAGDQKITLNWTTPDDGGSAITDYEYSSDAGTSWTSLSTTGTSATITGLTNFTEYTVIIRAKNATGAGAASSSVRATPNEGPLPKADGSFMSTDFSALSGEFLLNQNGSTQSGEKAFAAGEYIEIVAATNPGTDIALRLDAPPDNGQPSPANVSEIGIMTYEAGEQGRATGRGFKPGTEAAIYLFSDPLFLGHTTVQSDGTWEKVFDVPADIELGAHTIQAQGVLPNGDMKAATAGVRVARTAEAPAGLAGTPGDGEVRLSWTPPADGGSPIEDYEYATDGGVNWFSLGTTGASATIDKVSDGSDDPLVNDTVYSIKVRAVTAVGPGASSAAVDVTLTASAEPALPVPAMPGLAWLLILLLGGLGVRFSAR